MNNFFDDLDDLDNAAMAKPKARQQYICANCGGTGKWSGGTNKHGNSNCIPCKGKGYFLTSPSARAKTKTDYAKKVAAKQDAIKSAIADFAEDQPAMYADLRIAREHGAASEFITSLAEQLFRKGSLSPNQIAAWHRGQEKLAAMRAEREAARPTVDLGAVKGIFAKAIANGLKRASYRAEGFVMSPAPATGSNAGFTYVKTDGGEYMGKISPEGKISLIYDFRSQEKAIAEKLTAVLADPLRAAIDYGRKTGICCCCGRPLSDPASVSAGIGPVCASKWF